MAVVRLPTPALALHGRRVELGELVGRGSRTVAHQGLLVSEGGTRLRVLVKLYDATPSDDADSFVKNLANAVARAALVQHPNVAQVFEHGVDQGRAYLVTEHVPGVSLADLMSTLETEGQRLTFDVALFVGCEVADALAGAYVARDHEGFPARVIHGDLSARQVMLGFAGSVKVTDFELGRVSSAQSGVRSLRTVASRLEMLAPELVHGEVAGPRTDVFALGMLLRSMFVGPRFPTGIPHSQALAMVRKGEAHLPVFHGRVPQELSELIMTATSVAPEERFPNARALAYELRRIAFAHGVGDARPFLARALERAFPGESPYDADPDEEDGLETWPDDTDDQNGARNAADSGNGADESSGGRPYDSEFPPARRPPAQPSDERGLRLAPPYAPAGAREDHDSDAHAFDRSEADDDDDDDDVSEISADLARTRALPALRAPRAPAAPAAPRLVASHVNSDEDDFDPEATVNLRD